MLVCEHAMSLLSATRALSRGERNETYRKEANMNLLIGSRYAEKRQCMNGKARTATCRRLRTMKRGMISFRGDIMNIPKSHLQTGE